MKTCYFVKVDGHCIAIADLCFFSEFSYMITRINVPKEVRNCGHGGELLRQICNDADISKVKLSLMVMASGGLNKIQLTKWYTKYGFRYTDRGLMVRHPEPVNEV